MKATYKFAILICSLSLCCASAWAQYSATVSGVTGVDALSTCASGITAANCFVAMTGTPTSVSNGYDKSMWSVGSAGILYLYNISTHAWVNKGRINGHNLTQVAAHRTSFVVGVTGESGSNTYYSTNEGSSWTSIGLNCSQAVPDPEGANIYCLNTLFPETDGYDVYEYNVSGNSSAYLCCEAVSIAANDALLLQVNNLNQLWSYDLATGQAAQWTGLPKAPSAYPGSLAIGNGDDSVEYIGTDTNLYVSHDTSSTTWSKAYGETQFASITGPTQDMVGALSVAGGTDTEYHFNVILPSLTAIVTGTCGSACGSGHHVSATAQISMPNDVAYGVTSCGGTFNYAEGTGSSNGDETTTCAENDVPATQSQNVQVSSGNMTCDPLLGSTTSQCVYTISIQVVDLATEAVVFSQTGNTSGYSVASGIAVTGAEYTSAGTFQVLNDKGEGLLSCPVQNYCTYATSPPLCPAISPVHALLGSTPANPGAKCATDSGWLEQQDYLTVTWAGKKYTQCYESSFVEFIKSKGLKDPPACTQ